jgi:hypothetical protein
VVINNSIKVGPLVFLLQTFVITENITKRTVFDITLEDNYLVMFLKEISFDHMECGITASDCYSITAERQTFRKMLLREVGK